MKKIVKIFLSFTLVCIVIFLELSPGIISAREVSVTGIQVIRPVSLKNVSYIYQENVKKIDLSQFNVKNEALLPPEGVCITPGTVLVDEEMKTSYYVQGVNSDGTLIMRPPTMSEVFENFKIPKQTVKYNEGNIIDLQPNIQAARKAMLNPSAKSAVTIKKIVVQDNSSGEVPKQKLASQNSGAKAKGEVEKALEGGWEYGFENSALDAYFEDGTKISVTLSGKIRTNMTLEVDYSMFDGYDFGMNAAQMIGLKAAFDVKIKKEIYIPIIGIDIDFAIGGVRVGLFLVIGVDGDITLVVAAEEGTSFSAGIEGKTCFGIPTSFKPYREANSYYTAECDPNGRITAYAYLTPSISVRVLGINVFGAELRVGFKAYSIEEGTFLNYGVNAVVQLEVTILNKHKKIINIDFPLFSRKKEAPPGGFYFYGDLCAFRDNAVVAVYRAKQAGEKLPDYVQDPFVDKVPYVGDVQLYLYKASDTTEPYKVITVPVVSDDRGVINYNFLSEAGIDVKKGDSYRIVIPNNIQAFSSNVFSTIPFKGIRIDKADFFNEIAFGQVQPALAHRDLPGWALTEIKSDNVIDKIYCNNRTAIVKLVDPTNKVPMVTLTAKTDGEGNFKCEGSSKIGGADIRPYRKAIPYINIDGFEIEGVPIDTSAGVFFVFGSDYVTDTSARRIVKSPTGGELSITVTSPSEIAKLDSITMEEYTTGDHVLAVNEYGTKKIDNTVNYTTDAYFVENINFIYNTAVVASKNGATIDLRNMILGNTKKQLIYNDRAQLKINEGNNSQLSYFDGNVNDTAKKALQEGQALSTTHAYHRIAVEDDRYFSSSRKSTGLGTINSSLRKVNSNANITINKNNFTDITDPLQKGGVDAEILLNMKGENLTHFYTLNSVYVDTKATMDIEGYILQAVQGEPWIMEGHKQKQNSITPEDKLKREIERFMKEGVLYFKRFVVNQNSFANTKLSTWRPSANVVKHELSIDYTKGMMTLDGIKFTNITRGSMVKGKLYLHAATLARMMGGASSFDAKTGKLNLFAAGRKVELNTIARTSLVGGKSVSLKADTIGNNKDIMISTDAITKMFGATVKVDAKNGNAKVVFLGN